MLHQFVKNVKTNQMIKSLVRAVMHVASEVPHALLHKLMLLLADVNKHSAITVILPGLCAHRNQMRL